MAVEFALEKEKVIVREPASVQALSKGFFGSPVNGKGDALALAPEEALYLMDVRKAECTATGKSVSFNGLAAKFQGKKFLARYHCYKDWRDRGLVARPASEATGKCKGSPVVNYPSGKFATPSVQAKGLFFYDDLMSVIDDESARPLYDEGWYGQYGTYKAKKHGQYLKLDAYETLFLMKHANYGLNVGEKRVAAEARKRRPDFPALYSVYEDFRLRGYVVKTGFKFGTHFRLYFPGASPSLETGEWMHSKHVIQVFPREARLLISEWARAIRVAHGVKKTFILAIPGNERDAHAELDYLLYHRRKGGIPENPREDAPRYALLALSEEEEIGGEELSRAIARSAELGLELVLGISDRETSVTFYKVKRIALPESRHEYYEIEWFQP